MDPEAVKEALAIDPDWEAAARQAWRAAMELAVWGDLRSSRLGATARLRKRVLEAGERLKSLVADRAWIPHPREQLKNALASALNLRDCLNELERAAGSIDGGCDLEAFRTDLESLRRVIEKIGPLEHSWAQLLDAQYLADDD
ncbi:MAG: hypothetical protein Q8K18_09085 [Burkholderiales bacterium]|nr:hypothetical protein [Burkholderiales bacterium]